MLLNFQKEVTMNTIENLDNSTALGFNRLQEKSIELGKSCIEKKKNAEKEGLTITNFVRKKLETEEIA
jgi:hypothetical protein